MQITKVKLIGFRNFKSATVKLNQKSLIIGSNEVGKSNFIYALRILLDKTLSLADLEPQDSDFYVYEETHEIKIQARFEDICEDCALAKLREHVSDEGTMYLSYEAARDPDSKKKTFRFLLGRSLDTLMDIDVNRFYLRVLNLKFIGSRRNLFSYIRSERRNLLQDAREERTEEELESDNRTLGRIESRLDEVRIDVSSLTYVAKATNSVNVELEQLSIRNAAQDVILDTGASDPSQYVSDLSLATRVEDKTLAIGGDGRNNQIHLALWAARNRPTLEDDGEPLEVSLFCIEEPESHLHPHQQRKLAGYLAETLPAQVIITTHSPQIVCGFPPDSILRLYNNGPDSRAAGNGTSPIIEQAFVDFGYRLNIIPAEAFFASVVFLVEGPSEELFYKALAEKIGIDLDQLNISILIVDGVGFEPYVSLLHSLKIPYVIRTDNDVFKVPHADEYRLAGVQRGIRIYRDYFDVEEDLESILRDHEASLQGFSDPQPPDVNLESAQLVIDALKSIGIFLANADLETDLENSEIGVVLADFVDKREREEVIAAMQKRKATFMFEFLRQHSDSLEALTDDALAEPLLLCQDIANSLYNA